LASRKCVGAKCGTYQQIAEKYQQMPLTDAKLRNLKGADKVQKIADGGGLHVLVTPGGSRLCGSLSRMTTAKSWQARVIQIRSRETCRFESDRLHQPMQDGRLSKDG
jgi:hypothetical protein